MFLSKHNLWEALLTVFNAHQLGFSPFFLLENAGCWVQEGGAAETAGLFVFFFLMETSYLNTENL